MGYSTYFIGAFKLSKKLTVSQIETLLNITIDPYDVDEEEENWPNDRCPWRPASATRSRDLEVGDGPEMCVLESVNEEKMYDWDVWLDFLMEKYFKPWGIEVTGRVYWHGEDSGDSGAIFGHGKDFECVSIEALADHYADQYESQREES